MTTGMPELGSKISLISKADIRYEGRLFTVDPQECTIALASVRSFGTEEREAQFPVPAQSQVYDYILFRGTDIKDIRIVNNVAHSQPLNDPAIMQLSVPPSLGQQNFQTHPVLGAMGGPQMNQFGGYGTMAGTMGGISTGVSGPTGIGMHGRDRSMSGGAASTSKPSELINLGGPPTAPSSVLASTVEPIGGVAVNDHASVLDLIGGSRSTTPVSLGSRKSPTNDQGVQAGGSKRDDKKVIKPIQPPTQKNQRRHSKERREFHSRNDSQQYQQQNRNVPFRPGHRGMQHPGGQGYHNQQNYHNQHHQQSFNNQHSQGYQNNRSNNQGNNWITRGPMRARGRPRLGAYRGNQTNQSNNNKNRNTLKFDNDFDFEQANTQFEELRSQLGKVKLDEAGSSSTTKSETTGDVDKKDDSGNETGAGEPEQEEEQEVFYDKSKSFFDKISCEAVERAKGKSQRTDWRVERKLNSETFGVAATRRGAYRGRGGYRGMGYRGGYRPNYNKQTQRREPESSTQPQQQQPSDQGNQPTTSNCDEPNKLQETTATLSLAINSESTDTAASATSIEQSEIIVMQEKIPEPAMAVK